MTNQDSVVPIKKKTDKKVKEGDIVKVEYTGTYEDGTVFDASEKHGAPLEFQIGAGQVIKGFESNLIGMQLGEEKKVTIMPVEGYGEQNPKLVQEVPREQLPKDKKIKPGMMLTVGLPNGFRIPAKIIKAKKDVITIDFNHPLAGKTLNFKLKVVGMSEPDASSA